MTNLISNTIPIKLDAKNGMLRGMRAATPVMLGFIPFALVLGAQATQRGLSVIEVPLMTGLNFGGGSEFTAMRLWTTPPHIFMIVVMSFLVNSRHILWGLHLFRLFSIYQKRKLWQYYFLCAMKAGPWHLQMPGMPLPPGFAFLIIWEFR